MGFRLLPVIAVLLALGHGRAAAEPKTNTRVALVIGIAKYEAAVGPLRNAVNDAKAVAKTLRGLGFAVNEEHNVTRDELFEAVADFRGKLRGAEVALFYYAGHGISVGGSNYLVPIKSGYTPEATDDLTLRLLAETKLFNAEQVVAEMCAVGGGCNLVILDACRNTPAARNPRNRDLVNAGGLTEMKPPAGSLIAFATDAGRTALDGDGPNGLYTGELLKHLCVPGLTVEQVFKRTRAGVMKRSDGNQIPAEYSRLIGDDIYLAGPAPAEKPAPVLKAEPVKPPSPGDIAKLAADGRIDECVAALRLTATISGAGDYAVAPLDAMLELAKEVLKEATGPSPEVEAAMKTCELTLKVIPVCLPPDHPRQATLTAKAQNRRGDCLLLLGRAADALPAYEAAILLAPDDSYPVFNRGRAHLALDHKDEAKADFTTASSAKFNQPKARKLALKALAKLE